MEFRTYHIEILIGVTLVVWLLVSVLATDVMDGLIAASVVALVGTIILIYMGSRNARSSRSSRPDAFQGPFNESLQDYERAIQAVREQQKTLRARETRLRVRLDDMQQAVSAAMRRD